MEPQALLFFPGLDDFQEGLGEVIKKFQDAVLSVQNLVPDPYFDAFTQFGGCLQNEDPKLKSQLSDAEIHEKDRVFVL